MPRKAPQTLHIKNYESFKPLNEAQVKAYELYKQNDLLFLTGAAGTGKTFLAMAFAIKDIIKKERRRIILSRPIVEAGESLGYLPGDVSEKVYPYLLPLYDCLDEICGRENEVRKRIDESYEVAPLAHMRGRAQPLNAVIMTPIGPRTMGDMVIGSSIFNSNGQECIVTDIFPQGKKAVYRVSFSDGTYTECCNDHLWLTQTLSEKRHNKPYSIKRLEEIQQYIKTKWGQKNHKVPVASPVEFAKKEVHLDPYLLGLLLGDGCLHEKAGILFSTNDAELIESISRVIPDDMRIVYKGQYDWRISNRKKSQPNAIKEKIKHLNLLGTKSHNKFIPDDYKFNDIDTRLAVLQGLLDTDGSIFMERGKPRIQFYTTSEILARDVMFLVRSLGGVAYARKREYGEKDTHILRNHTVRHIHPCWVVGIIMEINPFRLSRKSNVFKPRKPIKLISGVEYVGEKECQCIKTSDKDELYLTDDFIVTHNTLNDAVCILDEAQNCTVGQLKLFLTRLGNYSKMIVTGDPTQSDLYNNASGLSYVVQKCKDIKGVAHYHFSDDVIVRHPLVAEIVKRI